MGNVSARPSDAVKDLFAQIEALSNPDRLRLAAGLLEKGHPEMAKSIVDRVSGELAEASLRRMVTR